MIGKLELVYVDGRFTLTASAERDRRVEAARLFYAALIDLIANPRPFCEAFNIELQELPSAAKAEAPDPAKLVNTPSVGGVN